MNAELLVQLLSALWLGILTSISPCPLATNVAAISFLGQRVDRPRLVLLSGLLYMLGRTLVYVGLAFVLVESLLQRTSVSYVLGKYMNLILGPLLIVVGMLVLDLIQLRGPNLGLGEKIGRRVASWGLPGAFALGVVFALSFCPASAGLFFGSLLALALKSHSAVLIPAAFGMGTALPVILFAALIAAGAGAIGRAYERITLFESWARRLTGVLFIAIGIYLTLVFIYRIEG